MTNKSKPLNMSPDCFEFLKIILRREDLDHRSELADFIRNQVLIEIQRKVELAYQRRSY